MCEREKGGACGPGRELVSDAVEMEQGAGSKQRPVTLYKLGTGSQVCPRLVKQLTDQ